MKSRHTVTICGGGLGGLTLGLALAKHGIPFQIFERAPGLSEVGAGITLWSNAVVVLRHLGVADAVRAIAEPSQGGVVGLSNGEILMQAAASDFENTSDADGAMQRLELWAAHRIELQRALYEQLPGGSVQFGMACSGYRELVDGVVTEFDAGVDVQSSLLVGADGVGSVVRSSLLGISPPRYAGYVCWRAVCRVPSDWSGVTGEFWGKGDRFGVVKLPGERLYWFAVVSAPEDSQCYRGGAEGPSGHKALLLDRFRRYHFDVPAIIEHTEPDAIIFHDIIDRAPQRGWSSRSVVLLGDAAHPTTPNMGQGAGMAMESALILARCLARSNHLRNALMRYERTRWRRTKRITETSWNVGRMAHWEHPVAQSLRNMLFKKTPAAVRQAQLLEVGGYDAASAPLAP